MGTTEYFIVAMVSLIIWIAILSWIIASSTQTKRRIQLAEMQIILLSRIAEKLGVEPKDISHAIKDL